MNIREKISEIIERDLHPIPSAKRDCTHKFYFQNYEDNLVVPMTDKHYQEYKSADGGEMEPKGKKPAKMASLTSSSAMTFNILGNNSTIMKASHPFAPGAYEISYEKQLYTLNKGSNPANLDAFLSNESAGEAIFCEMKMMEWLGTPNPLKEAYYDRNYYFDAASFDGVFSKIIEALRKSDIPNTKNAYPSIFKQYDAWQMFKHTLAIYNATSTKTVAAVSAKTGSMAGRYNKITLTNVVFEMDLSLITDQGLRSRYLEALELEHRESKVFIETMLTPENGLVELFKHDCGIDFDIQYIPVPQFVSMFDKTETELSALRRYCCK